MQVLYEYLKKIEEEIGHGAKIKIWATDEDAPRSLTIQVDWPEEDYHVRLQVVESAWARTYLLSSLIARIQEMYEEIKNEASLKKR